MANGIIGRLVSEELDLGDMNNTAGNIPFHAFPQKGAYLGPIAVLVDSFSASTSEIFAAALQEHQRARIFGRSTTAAVLPSVIEKLPNGDNFQYAVGDFVTALKKVHLEGKGVLPDEVIPLNTTLLLEGKDPDLEALVSEELDLGDMNNTAGNIPFHAFPQKGAYLGPIAVLVDSFSASTSEIFAAALQEHQRARIFGRSTTAAVLPSVIEKLPNGDNFQYAVGDFVTALKKVHLEGKGVLPDEVIPLNTTLLLEGKDPDLEAALSWLKTQ